jgi:leader peptidase (prepilin peptidase)/N-methyltransferase
MVLLVRGLSSPPSHCPKCGHPLAWYDNIPVAGWLMLRGRCRYCREPISPRYPIVEAVTGGLFVFYYVMFFIAQVGPCAPRPAVTISPLGFIALPPLTIAGEWPIYGLYMFLISALLAASLIDAELYIIPPEIPWLAALVGIAVHALVDHPSRPGSLSLSGPVTAMAAGAGVGLLLSMVGWALGWIRESFPQGEPILGVDRPALEQEIAQARREGRELPPLPPVYTRREIRAQMQHEMIFLKPPLMLGSAGILLIMRLPAVATWWSGIVAHDGISGLLGAVWGAMVGAFVIWLARIVGTLVMGRVAMGLGDVHLMLGVGAVMGAGASVVVFFLAPFFGLLAVGVMLLVSRTRRELPFGPYLSLATAAAMLVYCPIAEYFGGGLAGLGALIQWIIRS